VPPAEALRAVRASLGKDERTRAALGSLRVYGLGQRSPSTPIRALGEPAGETLGGGTSASAGFRAASGLWMLVAVVAIGLVLLATIARLAVRAARRRG
jgi:hypothetical protein